MPYTRIKNYKRGDITKEAKKIGIDKDFYIQRLTRHKIKHIPRYSDTEIYLLENFDYKHCAKYIPHKSLNALKIKQWRLKKDKIKK